MSQDVERAERLLQLGKLLRSERARHRWTAERAAHECGLGRSAWVKFETGQTLNPRPQTLDGIEVALDWERGSITRFLDGGPEPGPATALTPAPTAVEGVVEITTPADRDRLLADIRRELTQDEQGELRRQLLQAIVDAETPRER